METETCSICMEALRRRPDSSALAPPDMELAQLLCGHLFHAACVLQMYEHAEGRTDGSPACPNCRKSGGLRDMRFFPLAALAKEPPDAADEAVDAESWQSIATAGPEGCRWERAVGGDGRAFWLRTDLRLYEDLHGPCSTKACPEGWRWERTVNGDGRALWLRTDLKFFEDTGSWTPYQTETGRPWWHCEENAALWFFADTGAQCL